MAEETGAPGFALAYNLIKIDTKVVSHSHPTAQKN